jgi:hypothetical protein
MSDWGQGAKNNDIGWGQGAVNNDISWGASHKVSWAGDTEIVGTDGNAPVNTVAPVISGTALVGQTLTSTTGTWTSDTGVIGYLYQWYRGATLISGATNSTYVLTFADGGFNITCRVAATDTDGTSGYVSSNSINLHLLLDTYTNASVAYSLRKLRTNYTGSAIRVRRASDNSEMNIGFVNNELDTATLETFCSGTNGFVTTWYDQSVLNRNAIQTTLLNQPQIVSSGSVITINGKSAINFDGTNDTLSFTAPTTVATNMSAFAVRNIASYPSVFRTLFSYRTWGITYNSAGGGGYGNGAHIFRDITTSISNDYPKTNGQALDFFYNIANLERDNFIATLSSGFSYTNHQNTIGGLNGTSQVFIGGIQEIIIYEINQNSNKSDIKSNINTYYGIY